MEDYSLTILGQFGNAKFSTISIGAITPFSRQIFFTRLCEGAQMQMRRAKVPFDNLSAIFISIFHGDHYFGIFGLLASMNLFGRKNISKYMHPKGQRNSFVFSSATKNCFFRWNLFLFPKNLFHVFIKVKIIQFIPFTFRIGLIVGGSILQKKRKGET